MPESEFPYHHGDPPDPGGPGHEPPEWVPVDQIVFRWDPRNAARTTGFGPVAYSTDAQYAADLYQELKGIVRHPGTEPRASLARVRLEGEKGRAAILHRRLLPGGDTSHETHALIGPSAELSAHAGLGLFTAGWPSLDDTADGSPHLPVLNGREITEGWHQSFQPHRDAVPERTSLVTNMIAQVLRTPRRRLLVRTANAGDVFPVLAVLIDIFGATGTVVDQYCTHTTVESASFGLAFVRRWPPSGASGSKSLHVDPTHAIAGPEDRLAHAMMESWVHQKFLAYDRLYECLKEQTDLWSMPAPDRMAVLAPLFGLATSAPIVSAPTRSPQAPTRSSESRAAAGPASGGVLPPHPQSPPAGTPPVPPAHRPPAQRMHPPTSVQPAVVPDAEGPEGKVVPLPPPKDAAASAADADQVLDNAVVWWRACAADLHQPPRPRSAVTAGMTAFRHSVARGVRGQRVGRSVPPDPQTVREVYRDLEEWTAHGYATKLWAQARHAMRRIDTATLRSWLAFQELPLPVAAVVLRELRARWPRLIIPERDELCVETISAGLYYERWELRNAAPDEVAYDVYRSLVAPHLRLVPDGHAEQVVAWLWERDPVGHHVLRRVVAREPDSGLPEAGWRRLVERATGWPPLDEQRGAASLASLALSVADAAAPEPASRTRRKPQRPQPGTLHGMVWGVVLLLALAALVVFFLTVLKSMG
ncbi:hypothetical protein [Yinghuangia seranimata]|uniref:hypothetical protein n=1 Tax=Yinghuangia seranimata TaxID=408067 RepID=UPI00248CFD7B|nr:hypothetical protein [Yinghuangia seranimata]MDI2130369.1 hypothetical protein [Yinghuangia seranimata]